MDAVAQALERKKQMLKSLKVKQAAAPVPFSLLRGGVAAIVVFALGAGILTGEASIGMWVACAFVLLLVGAASVEAAKRTRATKTPEMQALQKEINALRKRTTVSREIAEVEQSLAKLEPQRYGCKTTAELSSLQTQRLELVRRIMGDLESLPSIRRKDLGAVKAGYNGKRIPDVIFGWVKGLTDEFGEGAPLPKNKHPFRKWLVDYRTEALDGLRMEMKNAECVLKLHRSDQPVTALEMESALKEAKRMIKEAEVERTKARRCSGQELEKRMDDLLIEYPSVVVCIVEDEVSVFTKTLGSQFPPEFLKKCRDMLHLKPNATVAWYQSVDSPPLQTTAATALYGETPSQLPSQLAAGEKLRLLRQRFIVSDTPALDHLA